jgi:hypothetical protein
LQDLRDALARHGLDITSDSAKAWGIENPIQAAHIDEICDLGQRVDDLTQTIDEVKRAAE